jgi:hypothetical protein
MKHLMSNRPVSFQNNNIQKGGDVPELLCCVYIYELVISSASKQI